MKNIKNIRNRTHKTSNAKKTTLKSKKNISDQPKINKITSKNKNKKNIDNKNGKTNILEKGAVGVIKTKKMPKAIEKNKEYETAIKEKSKILISESTVKEYLAKNIGSNANGILSLLLEEPNVDEKIAEVLKLKLNETRRMLNLLNNYGLVKYNINKDNNGWLTFVWYMDFGAVDTFSKKMKELTETTVSYLPKDCNDFFVCKDCSKTHAIIIPFDTAFESEFKCVCGKGMVMIEREKAEELYNSFNKN